MSAADLETNRQVRRVFVRHWIDLGRLSVRSSQGKVWIAGTLTRIAGVKEDLTTPIVESMFRDIKRIRSVGMLSVNLENWANDDGRWIPVDLKRDTTQPLTATGCTTHDISTSEGSAPP